MKSSGYVRREHTSDDKITPEDFKKMTYSEKVNFSQAHPEAISDLWVANNIKHDKLAGKSLPVFFIEILTERRYRLWL